VHDTPPQVLLQGDKGADGGEGGHPAEIVVPQEGYHGANMLFDAPIICQHRPEKPGLARWHLPVYMRAGRCCVKPRLNGTNAPAGRGSCSAPMA
jgi:hypothetical protein